jgi:CheY-like chemotaxis protein
MEQSHPRPHSDYVVALSGRRFLVVEDAPEDATRFRKWLVDAGAHVFEVGTLAAARQALGEGSWDAIVMDRVLPDGDAFEWLRLEHRKRGRLPIPPCVLVSAHLDEKTYESIYRIGAVPLPKHYLLHPNVLLAALGSALESFGAQSHSDEVDPVLGHPLLPRR